MVSMTVELSNEEIKELLRSSMKMDIFEGFLNTKDNSDLLYVRDIKKILGIAEVRNEKTV